MFLTQYNAQFESDLGRALGRPLTAEQLQSVRVIFAKCDEMGIKSRRFVSYILGTAWHESRLRPIEEIRAKEGTTVRRMQDKYWHTGFYGRGFVQLTHKRNYEKFAEITGVDIVSEPEKAMELEVSAHILVYGMLYGSFTGRKLSDYFTAQFSRWKEARRIVNGTFHADLVAGASIKIYGVLHKFA